MIRGKMPRYRVRVKPFVHTRVMRIDCFIQNHLSYSAPYRGISENLSILYLSPVLVAEKRHGSGFSNCTPCIGSVCCAAV